MCIRDRPYFTFDRRNFPRARAAGVVAASLPAACRAVDAKAGRAKSVLLVLLSGGPSQLDTVDPKPDAPAEVRGEFSTIGTAVAGVRVCEHLPKLAQQLGRWSCLLYTSPS